MRRDYQARAPEPMRSTLPNTDQPRIPHSVTGSARAPSARRLSAIVAKLALDHNLSRRKKAQKIMSRTTNSGRYLKPMARCYTA